MRLAILFSLKTIATPEWDCKPFLSDSIVFSENRIASVNAKLTLTLDVKVFSLFTFHYCLYKESPLKFCDTERYELLKEVSGVSTIHFYEY